MQCAFYAEAIRETLRYQIETVPCLFIQNEVLKKLVEKNTIVTEGEQVAPSLLSNES